MSVNDENSGNRKRVRGIDMALGTKTDLRNTLVILKVMIFSASQLEIAGKLRDPPGHFYDNLILEQPALQSHPPSASPADLERHQPANHHSTYYLLLTLF